MRPLAFAQVQIAGDLHRRAHRNFDRLEETKYQPDHVFLGEEGSGGWPGDTEGRTVLALALLMQAVHREPKHLAEILRRFPTEMNERGYFGTIHADGQVNEQQLSSHGWVLRGVCDHYEATGDPASLAMARRIVESLALPTAEKHRSYPIVPEERRHGGAESGTTQDTLGDWQLSTDIGCDYIFLDGLTHAYRHLPTPQLAALIDEMIERFLEIDLIAIKAQTHATLTALRSLLRHFDTTGERRLLDASVERYAVYRRHGMTENYANHNWFGRPEWTEPCAMVDSFIVAVELWRHTGEPSYLEDAHLIWTNAICHGQRSNGGFGPDTCAGAKDPFLGVSVDEAHWCCTMRGGEGLARAIQYSAFVEGDTVTFPFFNEGRFHLDGLIVEVTSGYPSVGRFELRVVEGESPNAKLRFFTPSWAESPVLSLNSTAVDVSVEQGFAVAQTPLRVGDRVTLEFGLASWTAPTQNPASIPGYHAVYVGPLIQSSLHDEEVRQPDPQAPPLTDMIDRPMDFKGYRRQVLFRS